MATPNLPEPLTGTRLYEPSGEGAEAEIAARLAEWSKRRNAAQRPRSEPTASEGGPPQGKAAERPRSEPTASEGGPPQTGGVKQ